MSAPGWRVELVTTSAAETAAAAAALAGVCRPGDLLLLVGGLGSGKTVFVQGFAAALGVDGPVTSPTFTLVHQYPVTRGPGDGELRGVVHADVYRLTTVEEMDDLGIDELVEEGAIGLVEWGDRAAAVISPEHLVVELQVPATGGPERRRAVIQGRGHTWEVRRAGVCRALAPFAPLEVPEAG